MKANERGRVFSKCSCLESTTMTGGGEDRGLRKAEGHGKNRWVWAVRGAALAAGSQRSACACV